MIWTGPRIELDDTEGIAKLLELCRRLAERAAATAEFRAATAGLDVDSIFRLVRDRIRYRYDPRDIELVIEPSELLRRAQAGIAEADCEDIATLAAAIARANGIGARLVAYGTGERWYHIAAELNDRGRWIAVDPVAGERIDTRPTLAREVSGNMSQMMVEGVGGLWDIFTGLGEGAKKAGEALISPEAWGGAATATGQTLGTLTEGAASIIDALSPAYEAYSGYKTAEAVRRAAEAKAMLPGASVLQYLPATQAAAPQVVVQPVPYGPQPAPGLGINTNTLLIGGAVIAALLLLKGK
ncbi:MAG: transglutaminase domain-containing protein [Pseudomonadota bacterium]